MAKRPATFVHPFDDPPEIASQSTIAREMLDAVPDLDTLVVPIGGGLISGVAIAAKHRKPNIRIVGAQSRTHPLMRAAIKGRDTSCPTG